jgi:3-oxoacyl-[acyl-carrier protein] reductase
MNVQGAALVFGDSRGIGEAIADRLAQDGFDVAVTYASRPGSAEEIVTSVRKLGRRAIAIRADSGDPAAICAVAETVARLGMLDVAVLNAGILRHASIDAFAV